MTPTARDYSNKIDNCIEEILRLKESIDIDHIIAAVHDGCVCGLCEAVRQVYPGHVKS